MGKRERERERECVCVLVALPITVQHETNHPNDPLTLEQLDVTAKGKCSWRTGRIQQMAKLSILIQLRLRFGTQKQRETTVTRNE